MISLLEKWMPPLICFFIILQETQTGETLRYCTISTLWKGNLCSNNNKYMRYILRWKFIEQKEVPEMLTSSQDRRLLLKTNNTNPDLCAVVSCYVQAVKERSRENITASGVKGFPSSPAFPLTARKRLRGNWGRVSYKPWNLQFTLFWRLEHILWLPMVHWDRC